MLVGVGSSHSIGVVVGGIVVGGIVVSGIDSGISSIPKFGRWTFLLTERSVIKFA